MSKTDKTVTVVLQLRIPRGVPVEAVQDYIRHLHKGRRAFAWAKNSAPHLIPVELYRNRVEVFAP